MHMAQEMQRLRAEHAALDTLSRFLMALVAQTEPPRPTELASVRGMFRDTLVRHLKCEDWALYPRLKASGDPELARLARDFIFEMGHIADEFTAYDARWTAARVASDWPGFRAETEAVLDAIAMRIEREEDELYPAAEQYDEPMARRMARH
jgi:hypothetical protein